MASHIRVWDYHVGLLIKLIFLKFLFIENCVCFVSKKFEKCNTHSDLSQQEFDSYEVNQPNYNPRVWSTSRLQLPWSGNTWMYVSLVRGNRDHVADVQEWSKFPHEEEILLSCCSSMQWLWN